MGVAAPTDADACSLPPPFALGPIAPADGATGVPTNAVPRVVWYGSGHPDPAELLDLVVRPPGGQAVAATIRRSHNMFHPFRLSIEVVPAAPLQPDTTYELAGRVRLDCFIDCLAPEHQVYRTFRTGAGPDTTPRTFAGATGVTYAPVERCTSSSCCGPYVGQGFELRFAPASDPSGIAGYRVYREGTLVANVGTRGHVLCEGSFTGGGPMADFVYQASGRYVVRAVDLAGNEDENDRGVDVVVDCAAILAPDAGVPDAGPPDAAPPDAPPAVDAAPAPPDAPIAVDAPAAVDARAASPSSDAGCTSGTHAPRGGIGSVIVVVALALCRLRRRARMLPAA